MAKKQGFSLSTAEVPAKSEYDDEELDFVTGKKIEVKSETMSGSGTSGGSKAYKSTSTASGSMICNITEREEKGGGERERE